MNPAWKNYLWDLIFPRACPGCREDIASTVTDPLCPRCVKEIKPMDPPLHWRGSLPVWAAFRYEHPLSDLIHAFKYRGQISVGRTLGEWMAEILPGLSIGGVDAVVPVPLHPSRLRERGFNQAEVLAEAVARAAGAPVEGCIERFRKTVPQMRLGRAQRSKNLKDAFRIIEPDGDNPAEADRAQRRLLIIDDVCTTGGTLEGCAEALRAAGFKNLQAFVLARD